MAVQIPQRVIDGIWDRVDTTGGPDACWPWKLSLGNHGYGQVGWGAKGEKRGMVTAMRATWTAVHGPIPDGMVIDHLCRNKPCCNPAHLRLLTMPENSGNNTWRLKTHCPKGHLYDEANTWRSPLTGWRQCRACAKARVKTKLVPLAPPAPMSADRTCIQCGIPLPSSMKRHAKYCSPACGHRFWAGRCKP